MPAKARLYVSLTAPQIAALEAECKALGDISVSELMRRILDDRYQLGIGCGRHHG